MPPSSEGIPNLEHFRQVRRRVVETLETRLSMWRKVPSVFRQPLSTHPKGINLGLSPRDVQLALIHQRLHRRRHIDDQISSFVQQTTVIRLLDHET